MHCLHLGAVRVAVAGDEDLGDDVLLQDRPRDRSATPSTSAARRSWMGSSAKRRWPMHAAVVVAVANLEAGVPSERTDADDENRPDGDLAAAQPARRRPQPEDARHADEDEAIEVAARRVRRHEEPQRRHHAEHARRAAARSGRRRPPCRGRSSCRSAGGRARRASRRRWIPSPCRGTRASATTARAPSWRPRTRPAG